MLDYRARSIICNTKQIQPNLSNKSCDLSVDDFFKEDNAERNTADIDKPTHIHPMDVQMAIYHCADNLLWQYVSTKLSFCQYALPYLVPNPFTSQIEFPSFSFRQIKKSWKCSNKSSQQSNTDKCKTLPIYEALLPSVSFIRFGHSSSSKSQILSALMNSQKHTFFHRHCKGSSATCHLMDGVVEISWYCPGGKEDDIFDTCVAFTNLRGDARQHAKQLDFLLKTATINVLLLGDSDRDEMGNTILKKLLKCSHPLICLCSDKEMETSTHGTKVKIGVMNRNEAELIEELTTTIKSLLKNSNHTSSIKTCTGIARELGFVVDEDHEHCKEGKSLAEAVVTPLKNEKLSVIKNKFLPLQGKLWHSWCKKNKELTGLKNNRLESLEVQIAEIEQKKKDIRLEQRNKARLTNEVIKSFISGLRINCEEKKKNFIKWLGIFLDDLYLDQCSAMQQQWETVQDTDSVEKKWEILPEEHNASTFGIEHLLREVGQMYEAFDSVPEKEMLSLPGFAADLMIAGYPIELMDGDASHVPLNWISSVLDQVIKKLGDKTFFVLSVLGIQSTGKSTLLNAMFGLQFAVSAGRCTRGAFMQMVKVKEEFKQQLKFDYLLVVDTEGLRTLVKQSTLNHDNELATFVIGLGNLTLINIFGENPSDMQDVLQIAVQAFLRMKQVKLSPSCMFVHQNVGEITAGEKNMEGRRRLQKTLDEMTRLAAKQEECDVMFFKDVIRLDFNTHIHYFAHLWEGNPPMAPPNPSYSENVQKLKQMILSDASNQNRLKISDFKTRIQNLWSALLAENFVFSFKNTLEIAAYRKLEEKYGEWTWKLRSHMLDIENKLNNRIEIARPDTLEINNLESEIKEEYDDVKSEMEKYFSEDEDQEILIQWKEKIKIKLAELKTELIEGTKRAFDKLIGLKQSCWRLDEKKSEYETKLFKSSKELASKLKANGLDENKLETEFQTLWSAWVEEVLLDMPPVSKTNIKLEGEHILSDRYNTNFVLDKKQECYQSLKVTTDFSKYLSMKSYVQVFRRIKNNIKIEDHNSVKDLTKKIILDINDYIKEKELAKADYHSSYIHEIVNKIENEIKYFETKETRFEFKMEYKKHLCGLLCTEAAHRFEEMRCAFLQANDPLTYLISKKDAYFSVFKSFCQGAICIAVFADFVGSKLKEAILQAVYDKASIDMAGEMRSNYPAFNGNRSKLENHIRISLAKKENFDEFMEYIHFHKEYFENFIAEHVDEYFLSGDNPRIHRVFKKYLKIFHSQVLDAIYRATGVVQDKSGDVPMWLDEFCKTLNNDLNLSRSDLKSVEYQDIKDINFLKEAMTTALENSVEDLRQVFDDVKSVRLRRFRLPPHEILFKQLCGCREKCPLCSARCTNTIPGHDGDHSVDFHRPQGISGVAWHNTDNLVTANCTSLVASNYKLNINGKQIPYKKYREASPMHAKWSITPDKSEQPYWKWFVCHFQSDIEKKYSKKLTGEIPEQWKSIKKSAAIESLNKALVKIQK